MGRQTRDRPAEKMRPSPGQRRACGKGQQTVPGNRITQYKTHFVLSERRGDADRLTGEKPCPKLHRPCCFAISTTCSVRSTPCVDEQRSTRSSTKTLCSTNLTALTAAVTRSTSSNHKRTRYYNDPINPISCRSLRVAWSGADVRFGSKADVALCPRDVRFTAGSGHPRSLG